MEFLEGIKVTDIDKIDAAGVDRALLATRTAQCYLSQLCQHGFFHCDPHPGARRIHCVTFVPSHELGELLTLMQRLLP